MELGPSTIVRRVGVYCVMNCKGAVVAGFEVLDLYVHIGIEGARTFAPGPVFEPKVEAEALGTRCCAMCFSGGKLHCQFVTSTVTSSLQNYLIINFNILPIFIHRLEIRTHTGLSFCKVSYSRCDVACDFGPHPSRQLPYLAQLCLCCSRALSCPFLFTVNFVILISQSQ